MTDKVRVEYGTVENGSKGVAIGQEDSFLEVKYEKGKKEPWGFKLINMRDWKALTAWINVKEIGKLRTSHTAKLLRGILKTHDSIIVDETLERVVTQIQDHEVEWNGKENDVKTTTPLESSLTEDEQKRLKTQALEFLKDPLLLYRIKQDMTRWVVGEEATLLLNFVLDVSCKAKKDYAFQIISADSAAGKTHIVGNVLKYLPSEWWEKVGRLSATALEHLQDRDFDLLWIQERRGGKEASQSIRLSSVEDGGTKVWITQKGETGQWEMQEFIVKGRSIITTTTSTNIDNQDLTRSWMLGVDETEEQTSRIHDYEVSEAEEPLEFRRALGTVEQDLRPVIHEALRQLDFDKIVIVPFAAQFKKFVSKNMLRSRRDLKKIIRLVRVCTLLFQKQRHCFTANKKKFVVAYPQDAYTALSIAHETFKRTSMGLDEREKKVMGILKGEGEVTRRVIAQKCGKSTTWASNRLDSLIDKGFVDKDESGKTHTYALRDNGVNLSESVLDRLDYPVIEKKVKTFLERPSVSVTQQEPLMFSYFSPLTGQQYNNSDQGVTVTHDEVTSELNPVSEKKPKHLSKSISDRLKRFKSFTDNTIDNLFPKKTIEETIILLRSKWSSGTSKETQEQDFLQLIHEVRPDLNRKEAGSLFALLIEEGLLTFDNTGLLAWVKSSGNSVHACVHNESDLSTEFTADVAQVYATGDDKDVETLIEKVKHGPISLTQKLDATTRKTGNYGKLKDLQGVN